MNINLDMMLLLYFLTFILRDILLLMIFSPMVKVIHIIMSSLIQYNIILYYQEEFVLLELNVEFKIGFITVLFIFSHSIKLLNGICFRSCIRQGNFNQKGILAPMFGIKSQGQ